MPPLRMNRTVQSTNYANDDTTTIIISETSTKTFFKIFQSETCCKATLVTRYFSGKVSCHAIELFIDYEHRCLTPCKLHSCSVTECFFKFKICILWLNGAVLPFNTEEDLISLRTEWRFSKEHHGDVHIFSSFRFVYQITVSPRKFRKYGRF